MENEFKKNHYFPKYNLQYFKAEGCTLYEKLTKKNRKFKPANNFHLYEFYYFDGTPEIEKRLGKIESYMAQLLKKIADAASKNTIELSEYDIVFIQLFLFLQASRQLNTTEVIKSDESGMYQSNYFLWGTHNVKNKAMMERQMRSLIKALESLIKKKSSQELTMWMGMQVTSTHLVIAKNDNKQICQSDVCCIIENDMDSNHMYTYFPQTPSIAFFLVKTKYFYREWHRLHYLARVNDWKMSLVLKELETGLYCEYDKEGFSERSASYNFYMGPVTKFSKLRKNRIKLTFFNLPNDIVNKYNKILFDDGTKFIHNGKDDLIIFLQEMADDYRKIVLYELDFENGATPPRLTALIAPFSTENDNFNMPVCSQSSSSQTDLSKGLTLNQPPSDTKTNWDLLQGTVGIPQILITPPSNTSVETDPPTNFLNKVKKLDAQVVNDWQTKINDISQSLPTKSPSRRATM